MGESKFLPMPFELRALAFRIVAPTLMALAVLLVFASLPGKPTTTAFGPIETTICADENGREYVSSFDVLFDPTSSPAVDAAATPHLRAPTLVPNIRRPTRSVLRL